MNNLEIYTNLKPVVAALAAELQPGVPVISLGLQDPNNIVVSHDAPAGLTVEIEMQHAQIGLHAAGAVASENPTAVIGVTGGFGVAQIRARAVVNDHPELASDWSAFAEISES